MREQDEPKPVGGLGESWRVLAGSCDLPFRDALEPSGATPVHLAIRLATSRRAGEGAVSLPRPHGRTRNGPYSGMARKIRRTCSVRRKHDSNTWQVGSAWLVR